MALLTQNGYFGPKWSFWVKMAPKWAKNGQKHVLMTFYDFFDIFEFFF
jgi:hypothetical protein